ncbi:MAG: RHS repeat-associated core domain-containing protein [Balneolaceae bacterium]|nr:RHS repeat-associated core domain-containing protein [Balneolaceae bacterium]MBO6646664.1 RHS repeat-associated core domain-containing protein [Balneolaceae bacterium]
MSGRYTTSNDDRYKFTGHELDEEVGLDLSYAGARYLDSEIGSWLSIDPMADSYPGWSPYNYTMGNPVNLIDPTGMMAECGNEHNQERCPGLLEMITDYLIGYHSGEYDYSWEDYRATYEQGLSNEMDALPHDLIHAGIEVTEVSSDAGAALQVGGILTVQPEIAAFGGTLEVGSDATNLGLKMLDASYYGGSTDAVIDQTKVTSIGLFTSGVEQFAIKSFIKSAPDGLKGVDYVSSRTNPITGRKGWAVSNKVSKAIRITAATVTTSVSNFIDYYLK